MTQKQKSELAASILKDEEKAKALFKRKAKNLDRLIEDCEIGEEIPVSGVKGVSAVRVIDNFEKGNTAFKPVGFNLFDIEAIGDEVVW